MMQDMRVVALAGWSGAGKTTLLKRLIPALTTKGYSVSTIKHAHHRFDVDYPGKDSYAHREAGAQEVLVASSERFALMHELRGAPEPDFVKLFSLLSLVDYVIVEGFKRLPLPKIEINRAENGKPFLYPEDELIRAVATDQPHAVSGLPTLALDDVEGLVATIKRIAVSKRDLYAAFGVEMESDPLTLHRER
jgi:molybdopterin-guanine dinucleotide biosynthesis protein B